MRLQKGRGITARKDEPVSNGNKLNGKTPAIALIIALTSFIPSISGLVTAVRDSGEDDARVAYQLLAQRLDFIEKQLSQNDQAHAKEIADLEDDLDDALERAKNIVLWLQQVDDGERGGRPSPMRRPASVGSGSVPTADELLNDIELEEQEEAAEPEMPPQQMQQQSPLPPSLDHALDMGK